MAIDKVLYFPITAVSSIGTRVPLFAPVVDSLTVSSTGTFSVVALVKDVGTQLAGLYRLDDLGVWRRALPYLTLSSFIFESVEVFSYLPNSGTTILQATDLPNTLVEVYRNAGKITTFTVSGNNVILNSPSQPNDSFIVLSFITTSSGGGGIPDAPSDNNAYVRKMQAWDNLNNQTLNEGSFGT